MTRNWSFAANVAVLLGAIMVAACAQAPDDQVENTKSISEAIINGQAATDKKYDAIGAIGLSFDGATVLDVRCSATLVGKQAILTARHCGPEIDLALATGLVPVFVIGDDALGAPEQVIPITGYVAAPGEAVGGGLLFDGGRDVAVAYLESAPKNVKPAKLGKFEDSLIGKRFKVAGYGERAETPLGGYYGLRYMGSATARTLGGGWYPALFNDDYDAFFQWYMTDSPWSSFDEGEAQGWWMIYQLEPGFELYAGGRPGDATPCHGDSGGPLFLEKNGSLTVYAVHFATEDTLSTVCGFGGGYVVLNDTMRSFVKNAVGESEDDSKPRKNCGPRSRHGRGHGHAPKVPPKSKRHHVHH